MHRNSGEPVVLHLAYPKGHPKNPMTDAEVEEKFIRLAEPLLTRQQCQVFFDFAWRLEKADDVGKLFGLLAPN